MHTSGITPFIFSVWLAITSIKIVMAVNCPKDHYHVKDNPSDPCLECNSCAHGLGLTPPCGSELDKKNIGQIDCKECTPGKTYSDIYGPESCKNCKICAQYEVVYSECTREANTNCSSTCEKGRYFDSKTHDCQLCSHCCNDSSDEYVDECKAHGMPKTQHCSVHRASKCTPKTTPFKTTPIPSSSPYTHHTGNENTSPSNRDYGKIIGLSVGIPISVIIIIIIITIIYIVIVIKKRRRYQEARRQSHGVVEMGFLNECDTCTFISGCNWRLYLIMTSDDKDGGAREGGKCCISCEAIDKTNSNKVADEDKKEVIYTWKKDGNEKARQQQKYLIFDPVEVSDFGKYSCSIECNIDPEIPKKMAESNNIFLNVQPGINKRYQRLNELQLTLRETIARDLSRSQKWLDVAEHFKMEIEDTKTLVSQRDEYKSAKDTLEWLDTTNPNLQVYDFCTYLKEIKLNNIVVYLEEHLTCPQMKGLEESSGVNTVSKRDSKSFNDEQEEFTSNARNIPLKTIDI